MQELWQDRRMMKFIIILVGILGMIGCHGDTHLSTDVNSALLQNPTNDVTVSVTLQGNVACGTCDPSVGMAIVATSPTMGKVANGLMNGIGSYALGGIAKSGDSLRITVTVSKESGLVTKSATATVPDGGGTITQDFQF